MAPWAFVISDRKAAILQELVGAQQELTAVLDRVGPGDWSRLSPAEGWSVRDLLTHLATSETGFNQVLPRMAAGQGGVPADWDPNRWNAGQLRRRAEVDPAQLRAELQSSHEKMLGLLQELDDAALDQRGYMSSGSEGTCEDNFRLVASHKRSHTNDIRAALGVPTTGG
jgi:uncharacterized protein (TIGR03083 family)